MLKHTRRYLATAAVATAAGLAALGGVTAAIASPVARPAARATVSGTEHFQLITTSATSNRARVITYGGHGTYHLIVLLIAARNSKGQCSQTKLPLAFQQIITGSGPVHL
jgi:hypothetical protein